MASLHVPTIDITSLVTPTSGKDINKIANTLQESIGTACEQWGFFYIVNHGVDPTLIQKASDLGRQFFKMPKTFKDKVARREDNFQGYSDSELTKQKVDWKQVFDFTPEIPDHIDVSTLGVHGENQWPDIPQFQQTMEKYLENMQKLARILMEAIIGTLITDSDKETGSIHNFVEKCFEQGEETSVCRLNYYPVCPDPTAHLGVGPHSDPGILTILLQDNTVSSLQVQKDGKFYDVPPVPNSFVINIGDMMQVWSNGKYKGPVHRVLANHESDRFSLPFFLAPSYSCIVDPLMGTIRSEMSNGGHQNGSKKYKPIHWGHFRKARYEGDFADRGEEIQISHFEI